MMRTRLLWCGALILLLGRSALGQQQLIIDPGDFVDPLLHKEAAFVSRLVVGGVSGDVDDYRPLHENVGAAELANSLYWGKFQVDYKHSEVFGKDKPISVCLCNGRPIYFPTPPSRDSIPSAPPPGRKETVQVAWYHASGNDAAQPPVMRRYRLSASWQSIPTDLTAIATGDVSHFSGRELSFGLDADTYFHVRGFDVGGSVFYARTASTGTPYSRAQNELGYTSRFPGRALGPVLLRATLTVGGVTGRGASGLNIVNPAFEAFWHHSGTDINLHLVWSPLAVRSGAEGWQTHHQIALFVDRALYVKLFRPRSGGANVGQE